VTGRTLPFVHVVTAELRDIDGFGHVNNAVYLTWFEEARTRYVVERLGVVRAEEISFVLGSTSVRFLSPVRMLEAVEIACGPVRVGTKSWEFAYVGRARGDGRTVVDGRSTQVMFDYARGRTIPIPDAWRRVFETDLVPAPAP
jgi:acyl-CoA thioester hydrolase